MSIADRVRAGMGRALVAEMRRVSVELKAQAPIPDVTAPPLEKLQQILSDLKRRQPRRNVYLEAHQ